MFIESSSGRAVIRHGGLTPGEVPLTGPQMGTTGNVSEKTAKLKAELDAARASVDRWLGSNDA